MSWKSELGNMSLLLRAADEEQGGKAETWRINPEILASL